jgi:GNAT superfamily N-acetyltransferase
MYTVNQLNNKQNLSNEDLNKMREVYKTIGYSFKGPLSTPDFQHLEMEHYEDVSANTQFFYLSAENGDIVSVLEIVPRKGLHEKTLNLLLSMVFTNPDYRKQGLIQKLINWVIKYYETEDFNNDSSLNVAESIKNGTSQKYIDSVIPKDIKESNKIHWSLYSIVGTFYQQFGFSACDDINWLQINSTKINSKFTLDSNTEKLLTVDDLDTYYHHEEYTFNNITEDDFQNCAFEESTYPGFVARFQSYLKLHESEFPNTEFIQNCGIVITDPETLTQTIAFVCPFFFMNRIVVNRVYTDAKKVEIFEKQWQKVVEFIYHYAQSVWNTLPPLADDEKIIMLADNDFVSKEDIITKEKFVEIVTTIDGWENKKNDPVLPMIRDWKLSRNPPSKLAHNGHWSFM